MNNGPFGEEIPRVEIPRPPLRRLASIALLLVAVGMVFSSFYTIGPEETGVVLRFGKYVRDTDPGLHFKIPLGIERAIKVPVQRQLKEEFGFRTVNADVRTQYTTRGYSGESNMLTGDLNAAVVEWIVQYRIVDPYRYLFRVRNVKDTFRAMSEAVMREVVGDRTVNEILTVGRQEAADVVEQKLQVLCKQYELGVQVEQIVLQDVTPPDPVKPSFNEVNEAQQERERLINEAQSEYNQVIPRARGEAEQTIQQAQGYALDRVNRATGDAKRFDEVFAAYQAAPEVTRRRMYLETLEKVLPKIQRKVIVDDGLKGILPLLNLDAGTTPPPAGGKQ
jgi:membrane protease subunit HflK